MSAEPRETLSQPRLNRALLARQLLLERARLPIPEALERLAGIQNQYAPNAYIRLWSCLDEFGRDDLTRAYERGEVVQGTLMRGTIHAVSADDYRPFVAAVRDARREWANRIHRGDGADRAQLVARIRRSLRGGTVTRTELHALRAGATDAAWSTVDTDAELIRAPPSGTWARRRADLFGLADDVIGRRAHPPQKHARAHLIARYLAAFGPATANNVADFTGIRVTQLKPALEAMALLRYRDEGGKELLDVPDGALPPADTPAPVRFLPTWDAVLLIHARRTLILPEAYRPIIFSTKVPPSFPTFLVDGQVAGTWRFEDGRVRISPLRRLSRSERGAVDDEAARLASFHAD